MGGDVTSGGLSGEVLQCLYGLCLCFSRCGEVDLAIHSGFRCLELATKVFTQQQQQHSSTTAATAASRGGREAIRVGRPAPRRPVAMIVSTLLLLCDLYMKKKEVESAFEILQEAWTEIKNSYGGKVRAGGRGRAGYRTVAQSLCRVAVRVLELIIFSLPLQTRSLFDSVSGQMHVHIHTYIHTHIHTYIYDLSLIVTFFFGLYCTRRGVESDCTGTCVP